MYFLTGLSSLSYFTSSVLTCKNLVLKTLAPRISLHLPRTIMAKPSELVQHIESYVDASRSASQQAASLDAITVMLKEDLLTVESMVKNMEMYLTTTDADIRSRGILLLAELLTCLVSKPLDSATLHSLIGFFSDRLADWKAIRGALVGCLALLSRKTNVGAVSGDDARAVAQSVLENIQVQDFGQHDRKLCFKLIQCLLHCYPIAVAELGDTLVYGVCAAIDGEKDPQCLMLTFHIVEALAQVFPDPEGTLVDYAEDLFEILGCYFPIHFTHPKNEDIDVKRDDLSTALMLAFSSTPLFEPFVIPLLLEKLSSALPSAKLESLKYFSFCTAKYGEDRMHRHAGDIWTLLKDAIYTSRGDPIEFLSSELLDTVHFRGNEFVEEALVVLQKIITHSKGVVTSLIVTDESIDTIINSISSFENYNSISLESRQKLHAAGCILHVSARTSLVSCNEVFKHFFYRIISTMGISERDSSGEFCPRGDFEKSKELGFISLYLCIELLAACRELVVGCRKLALESVSALGTWTTMLNKFSHSLARCFSSILDERKSKAIYKADVYAGVKGLQILATFPASFSPISKTIFENILTTLTSVITSDFNNAILWRHALSVLVSIGSFIEEYHESEKALHFTSIAVERITSLVSLEDSDMPFSLRLEAICNVGAIGLNYMLAIVQSLEGAISANLTKAYANGNTEHTDIAVQLLEVFSNKVLPWFQKTGGLEKVPLQFVTSIWNHVECSTSFSNTIEGKEILDAIMKAVKLAVSSCSEESQKTIIEKAYNVISCSNLFPLTETMPDTTPTQLDKLQNIQDSDSFTFKDELLISLFSATIMGLRAQTRIPKLKVVANIFLKGLLKGHIPSAQALGSLVNKLPSKTSKETSGEGTVEEALDVVFGMDISGYAVNGTFKNYGEWDEHREIDLTLLSLITVDGGFLSIYAITGLAWIGKGLLMRGHEKAKDIIRVFLKCLESKGETGLPLKHSSLENECEQTRLPLMKSAADAFQILISNSENCLNKRFHAVIRPLYQQRLFSTLIPILLSSIMNSGSSTQRYMLYRAFGHLVSNTPLTAISSESNKLIPVVVDALSMLSEDSLDKDNLYSLLLVLSGLLTDKNGQATIVENAHTIIKCLIGLVCYPYMTSVRETAVQCLGAMSVLPHTRIYPMKSLVLGVLYKALDDPKRVVRQEAVRCRRAWAN